MPLARTFSRRYVDKGLRVLELLELYCRFAYPSILHNRRILFKKHIGKVAQSNRCSIPAFHYHAQRCSLLKLFHSLPSVATPPTLQRFDAQPSARKAYAGFIGLPHENIQS